METIIGLLFVLLPVIFKLIGKRLEQAGKNEDAGMIREITQTHQDSETVNTEFDDIRRWLNGESEPNGEVQIDVPLMETAVEEAPPAFEIPKTDKKKGPILLEEDVTNVKKEKIDPKKLVIYSEIMNPKYTE